jgi:hypothetical protein
VTLFSGPEYASYIALCRELRLERDLQEGDWYFHESLRPDQEEGWVLLAAGDERAESFEVWLPRLDQWLAMLEEAGADCPEFDRETTTGHYVLRRGMPDEWGHSQYGTGQTREEAAARLWRAVTGRTGPA